MVRPVTNAEWDSELQRSWFYDVMTTRTPVGVLFANRLGLPDITDDDVEELVTALKQVPTLRVVQLDGTKLTPDGVAKVKAALPFCIVLNGHHR